MTPNPVYFINLLNKNRRFLMNINMRNILKFFVEYIWEATEEAANGNLRKKSPQTIVVDASEVCGKLLLWMAPFFCLSSIKLHSLPTWQNWIRMAKLTSTKKSPQKSVANYCCWIWLRRALRSLLSWMELSFCLFSLQLNSVQIQLQEASMAKCWSTVFLFSKSIGNLTQIWQKDRESCKLDIWRDQVVV